MEWNLFDGVSGYFFWSDSDDFIPIIIPCTLFKINIPSIQLSKHISKSITHILSNSIFILYATYFRHLHIIL